MDVTEVVEIKMEDVEEIHLDEDDDDVVYWPLLKRGYFLGGRLGHVGMIFFRLTLRQISVLKGLLVI